jgi:hypothetical protein
VIAPWVSETVLRCADWRSALAGLAQQLVREPGSAAAEARALELGAALEYVDPDGRRAIEVYALAGAEGEARALVLAEQLGWWDARARLHARGAARDPARLLDEAEAWWDADQPALAAQALAGVRAAAPTDLARRDDLAQLLTGKELLARAELIAARAEPATTSSADTLVSAARFALAAGAVDEAQRWLEAAIVARPGHGLASQLLLRSLLATAPAKLRGFLRLRLDRLGPTAWLDALRTTALTLVATDHHRGYGLRLLRQALERAYQARLPSIPGHLAMWHVLAAQAAADRTRRELFDLVVAGLGATTTPVDRVWLGALATECCLRDAGTPILAAAYADMVAEHAPDHPTVADVLAAIAPDRGEEPAAPAPAPTVVERAPVAPGRAAPTTRPATVRIPVPTDQAAPAPAPAATAHPALRLPPLPRPASPRSAPALATGRPTPAPVRIPDWPVPPPVPEPAGAVPRSRRILIPIDVRLELADGSRTAGHSRDLSASGLYVVTLAAPAIGAEVGLVLSVPGPEPFMEDEYQVRARVARRDDEGLGLELLDASAALLTALAALAPA